MIKTQGRGGPQYSWKLLKVIANFYPPSPSFKGNSEYLGGQPYTSQPPTSTDTPLSFFIRQIQIQLQRQLQIQLQRQCVTKLGSSDRASSWGESWKWWWFGDLVIWWYMHKTLDTCYIVWFFMKSNDKGNEKINNTNIYWSGVHNGLGRHHQRATDFCWPPPHKV